MALGTIVLQGPSLAHDLSLSAPPPPRNLDLSRFCIGQKDELQQPPVYDLYAVINHYGGMIGGHYTAYARLPSDNNSQRSDVGQYQRLTGSRWSPLY